MVWLCVDACLMPTAPSACTYRTGTDLGATRRRGRPRKHPSGPAPAPAADSPLQPTAAGEGLANVPANGSSSSSSSSGSSGSNGTAGGSSSVMQRRADDMLRGELLSALLKRRGISQDDGSPAGSSSSRTRSRPLVTRWPVSDSQVGNVCLHWHSCASDQVSRELVAVQVRGSA